MGSMFSSPKMPSPMDVNAVAGQANDQNLRNAQDNARFNRIGQTDQFGNQIRYNADGSQTKSMGALGQQFSGGLGGMGQRYMDAAGQGIGDSSGALNQAYDWATSFSAPRMERQTAAMDMKLLNKGLDPSSAAYKGSMTDLAANQSAERNQLAAALQNQFANQGLAQRQQQMGELMPGLRFGMGTLGGDFANVPQVGVQNVDVAGLAKQNQADQWQGYNAQQQQKNAMWGALGGMAGSLFGGPFGGYLGKNMFGGM